MKPENPRRVMHAQVVSWGDVQIEVTLVRLATPGRVQVELALWGSNRERAVFDLPSAKGVNSLIDVAVRAFSASIRLRGGARR